MAQPTLTKVSLDISFGPRFRIVPAQAPFLRV